MTDCRYRMLALDLDGTLLDARGRLHPASIGAVRRAREHGLHIMVCTGRGLVESRVFMEQLGQTDPVAVAGGAITADPVSGATVHRVAMADDLTRLVCETLLDEGHAPLVLKDPHAAGFDYLVPARASMVDPVTRWWFETNRVSVRYARAIDEDEHPEHTIRVGMCADAHEAGRVAGVVAQLVGDRALMHAFKAVVGQDITGKGERTVHILEAFDAGAGKWPAIRREAAKRGIAPTQIAAIGDEINDLNMIENAGLGVAMGNAAPSVKAAADRETGHHDEGGAGAAIEKILSGEW
jgi:hydroxymethylpyrimidine pyrophosphatase-like HAD family hydrolase